MSQYSAPTSDSLFQQAVADQNSQWIHSSALARLLKDLKTADVSTQAGRQTAFERITSVIGGAPYQIIDGGPANITSIRFGTTSNLGVVNPAVTWFALFCDGWASIFSTITGAVQYRNRAENKTQLDNSGILEVDQSRSTPDPSQCRNQYNDSTLSFRKAVEDGERKFRLGQGMFNFKSFEEKYALVWSATAPTTLESQAVVAAAPRVFRMKLSPDDEFHVPLPNTETHKSPYTDKILHQYQQDHPNVDMAPVSKSDIQKKIASLEALLASQTI